MFVSINAFRKNMVDTFGKREIPDPYEVQISSSEEEFEGTNSSAKKVLAKKKASIPKKSFPFLRRAKKLSVCEFCGCKVDWKSFPGSVSPMHVHLVMDCGFMYLMTV
mmetsp:Transcript_17295/g.25935  ORF Transcript_17295/g.25935 Transcript_17295/m.25935 type:complete len:107 (+) Transcript_17295:89-409(+)